MDRKNKKTLFDNLYMNYGKKYQFVYRCNHSITDIQYRELLELLRMNCYTQSQEDKLLFMTREQMEEFLWEFEREVFGDSKSCRCEKVSFACKERIARTIVIENYHTCSLVYIPNNIQADIEKIVYESGYVFSCSENVYCQLIDNATYDEMKSVLKKYYATIQSPFGLYVFDSKQNFGEDNGYEDDFKDNGVVSLQIDSEHYYLGDISVAKAINKLERCKYIKTSIIREGDNNRNILWMFKDRCMEKENKISSQKCYFIAKTLLVNKNSSYLFDTDHPAWNDTLIPHTFVSAMLNIGRGTKTENGILRVLDPMVGSGTMAVEAAKYANVRFIGGDINSNAEKQVKYNLDFFSMDYATSIKLAFVMLCYMREKNGNEILLFLNSSTQRQKNRVEALYLYGQEHEECAKIVLIANSLLSKHIHVFVESSYECAVQSILQELHLTETEDFCIWCFVYLFRKTYLRHFKNTDKLCLEQFEKKVFLEMKSFFFRVLDMADILKGKEMADSIVFRQGFNKCITVDYKESTKKLSKVQTYSNLELVDFLEAFKKKEQNVDIVITDPPYGYNTKEQDDTLYELYYNLAMESVKCLNNGGQIIICLASQMHQGKRLPGFIKKEFVLNMFREAAKKNQMYIVECDEEIRRIDELYDFPFFWEAKKVLKREVIRLQFLKKLN